MVTIEKKTESKQKQAKSERAIAKVAVACQGGGAHAAFEVGVLTEILKDVKAEKFELVGLSGTSAGALCALMVWYGLAPKNGVRGTEDEASTLLNEFWENFVANTPVETLLNFFTYRSFKAEEAEIPWLGINAPLLAGTFNPYGAIYNAIFACLPRLGVRQQYFDLDEILNDYCPKFKNVDWQSVKTRLLIGASEVVNGFETVFDSGVNRGVPPPNQGMQPGADPATFWRQRLPLSLEGVAASGTLPIFREAEHLGDYYYWDGLYSHNPPVRDFFSKVPKEERPDELWIIRINPQQRKKSDVPKKNAFVMDRENELMGNLSLNKELDFIMFVNDWHQRHGSTFPGKKQVIVRTIKMTTKTADALHYSSKFNRSVTFMNELREEGHKVARSWLNGWPNVGKYPEDASR
jgi:NTE family protein